MATAKMETAADKYRRLAKEKQEIHSVTCECGMEWKCRRAPKEYWAFSGMLPLNFVETFNKLAAAGDAQSPEDAGLSPKELETVITFSNKTVSYTAVEPKIVAKDPGENELTPDELMMCCYTTLRNWQIKGGDEAAGLNTFRDGQ